MRTIVIAPYNPLWPKMFQQEAGKIAAIFGPELVGIHHIGSTSVPGLSAKPIIDMMPVVRAIEKADSFNAAMQQLGYVSRGEFGIPGRRYFYKGDDESRTHHVHVFGQDNPEVACHLDFRDYLVAHPAQARQYANLKIGLAKKFPHNIEKYMDGKDAFIKSVVQKAQAWRCIE